MTTSEQLQEWAKLWIESQPLPGDDLFGSDEEQPPQQPITESAAASAAIVLPPGADTNKLDDPNGTVPEPVAGTVESVDQKVLFKHVMQNMPLRCVKQIYSGNVGTTRDPSCPMQKLATSSHCIRSAYSIQKLFITMADQALDHAQTTSTVSGIQIGVDGRIWFPAPKPQVMVSSEVSQDDAVSDKPDAAADEEINDLEDELAQLVAKRRRLDAAGTKPATKAAAAKAAKAEVAVAKPAAKAKAGTLKALMVPKQQVATSSACKLAFFGEINSYESSCCLSIGELCVTNAESGRVEIFMHGICTPNSMWPSLAFMMPSSADEADVTMEILAETKIIKHSVGNSTIEVPVHLPYLSLKDGVAKQYKEGALIPLIRPTLPSEQIKSSNKLMKAYLKPNSMLEMFQSVHPDLIGGTVPGNKTPKAAPADSKSKTPKAAKASNVREAFEHMTKPPLLLGKMKKTKAPKGESL